jgi:DNA-binding response OmpR family regulator
MKEAGTMAARVLLLEYDVVAAREIQAALVSIGCAVEILRDGNAGLARAVSQRFDLVIASLELPGMNGFRLCNRLKKDSYGRSIPFFLISSQSSPEAFEEHRKLPTRAESYFHEPLAMGELVARVRATVAAVNSSDGDTIDDLLITETGPERDHGRELSEARASFEQMLAAKTTAVSRLQREVDQWKARASIAPGPITSAEANSAHGQLLYREQLLKKDGEIAALNREIEVLERSAVELKQKVTSLETARSTLEQTARDLSERAAHFEKLFSAARPDRDQAIKRADDLARRFERVRPDIERVEQELAAEKEARESEAAAHARTIAELNEKHDLATAKLAAVERMLEDKFGVELATARAEHVDVLATAEQGFQHRLAVLRHEHEGAIAQLKAAARATVEQANDRVAASAREAREKVAEARRQLGEELAKERRRIEELSQVVEERDALLQAVEQEKQRQEEGRDATLAEYKLELTRQLGDAAREATNRIQGLEALVASRIEDIDRLGRELDGLRAEVPALEAENAALRVELTSIRLRLDDDAIEEPTAAVPG